MTNEVKSAKNKYWEKTCEEIERYAGNTRVNKAWKVIKGLRRQNKDVAGLNLISMQEWKEYYQKLLTEDRRQFMETISERVCSENGQELPIITAEEVKKNVVKLKNGKSPGLGNISNELLKAAPSILFDILANIFTKCLNEDNPPQEWKRAIITSIYKKGSRKDCKNYRGVSIICSVARLYGRILKQRIEGEFRESEEQNGFRAGRSCTDGIFTIKHLMEKSLEKGRPVHLTFVDTIPLCKLWSSMQNNEVSKGYINAVKNCIRTAEALLE